MPSISRVYTRVCELRCAAQQYFVPNAKAGQKTPDGYYNVERMLKRVLSGNGKLLLCGTCMDARGLDDAALMAGARRSTMDELAAATVDADKVLVF